MHEELRKILIDSGLSEAEAQVYIELMSAGAGSKWDLVVRTGMDKNKVYRAFEQLEQMGLVGKNDFGIEAFSLHVLVDHLKEKRKDIDDLLNKIKGFLPFLKIPTEAVDEFEVTTDKERILNNYMMMSEVKYDTCLDFGDLEGFVPVLGGMDPVFKFRVNRFKQMARNRAICTTVGPFTSCMARSSDMKKFKSNIRQMQFDFSNKWIIFSDTNDFVMINDFSNAEAPSSVLIKSPVVADGQRLMFEQLYKNFQKF